MYFIIIVIQMIVLMCLFFLYKYINICRIDVSGLDENYRDSREICLKWQRNFDGIDNDIVWKNGGISNFEIKNDLEELVFVL